MINNIPLMPVTPPLNRVTSPSIPSQSVENTFKTMLNTVSSEIQEPYKLSEDMASGKKPFDATELVVSIMKAEQKMNLTIRVINDITKGIKQLEAIQA